MLRNLGLVTGVLVLAGCSALPQWVGGTRAPVRASAPVGDPLPLPTPELQAPPPQAGARTPEALDTTTAAQKAAATAAPAPAGAASLGKVTVSLGDPTLPGFWLRSSLVSAPTPGMIKTAGGQTVQVDLLPGEGAAQLSLAGFRALGLGLTDLPMVDVYPR